MLTLARLDHIDRRAPRRQRSHGSFDTEQDRLRDIAEVEADAAAVRPTVFAPLGPDDIRDVAEPPRLHHLQSLRKQGVGYPQVQVGIHCGHVTDRELLDLLEGHRPVPAQTTVLGSDLAGSISEPPRRVGQNGLESSFYCRKWSDFRRGSRSLGHPLDVPEIDLVCHSWVFYVNGDRSHPTSPSRAPGSSTLGAGKDLRRSRASAAA